MKIKEKSLKGFKDHLLEANKTVHVYAQVHSSIYIYMHKKLYRKYLKIYKNM